jgi:NAD-dependent dihydropyrimidine dehydrogenase PreA subunit
MSGTTNGASPASMNEANARDPFNNNSYGTLVDHDYKMVSLPVLDVLDFNERVIRGYEEGWGERELPADLSVARSLIPAGTATLRDFSNIAPEIPEYIPENCTACMDCVTECPDTAILGKVLGEDEWEQKLLTIPEADREMFRKQWSKTKKYYDAGKKKGLPGGMFNIIRPVQVQGLRRMRHRLRRRRPENDSKDRRGDDQLAQEPPLFQEHRPFERQVYQRQSAH